MDLLIFFVIIILTFLLIYFMFKTIKIKKEHRKEVFKLQNIISELLFAQKNQSNALQLSDDLKLKLQSSREIIDKKMLDIQNELITKLVSNNLVE